MDLAMRGRGDLQDFLGSLDRWVKMQKQMLKMFRDNKERISNSDRLEMVHATRIAFNHMIRTLKAFDQWLQDPFITSHIPREKLQEVWEKTMDLLEDLLNLDIKHTSEIMEILEKSAKEGTLNPITSQLRELATGEERQPRGPTLSI